MFAIEQEVTGHALRDDRVDEGISVRQRDMTAAVDPHDGEFALATTTFGEAAGAIPTTVVFELDFNKSVLRACVLGIVIDEVITLFEPLCRLAVEAPKQSI